MLSILGNIFLGIFLSLISLFKHYPPSYGISIHSLSNSKIDAPCHGNAYSIRAKGIKVRCYSRSYCNVPLSLGSSGKRMGGFVEGPSSSPNGDKIYLSKKNKILLQCDYTLLEASKLHHGYLSHADGNGDWVLTIFMALSLIVDVLDFIPSHVAVVFDHNGIPFGHTSISSKESIMAKGLNFRHTLYPSYKSNRPPTPDTIVQGLQYLKASIKAMSIKVIEVPGVEADDVIGTLSVRSVDAGYKVRVVSPDKDFFQILSPSLRLLRIAPRGFEMTSFGMEDFAKRYGNLEPSQFVDVISLVGDKSDNIPGSFVLIMVKDPIENIPIEKYFPQKGSRGCWKVNIIQS
ncbi:hypothetical protein AAG906_009050 [Vitis piasezkii]